MCIMSCIFPNFMCIRLKTCKQDEGTFVLRET